MSAEPSPTAPTWRRVVSLPLLVVQTVLVLVIGLLFDVLPRTHRRVGRWLFRGGMVHVALPFVRARRRVLGLDAWQVEDCVVLGVQPTTAAEVGRAEASDLLVRLVCDCEDPACRVRRTPTFVPLPKAVRIVRMP